MKKQTIFSLKNAWFASQIFLLSATAVALLTHDDNTFGICEVIVIAMSYPLNMIVAWLFFVTGNFFADPGMMFLMMVVMSAIGYVQWFRLMPRIARFFGRKFARHDLSVRVNVEANRIGAPAENLNVNEWQTAGYDENDRTPLERVFASANREDK
jgi:hypothetical protein